MNDYETIANYGDVVRRQIQASWNPEQENILKAWAEKASGWAWLHDKSSRYYNSTTNRFTFTSIILSTLSGGLGFMVSNWTGSAEDVQAATTNRYISFTIACMNILSAGLTSMQKFVQSSEKAEVHSQMNKMFSSFCRRIVLELALQDGDRRECIEFCKSCRDEYDRLVENSPEVPMHIILNFKRVFKSATHVPEIANGLVHFVNNTTVTRIEEFQDATGSSFRIENV